MQRATLSTQNGPKIECGTLDFSRFEMVAVGDSDIATCFCIKHNYAQILLSHSCRQQHLLGNDLAALAC